ncbi:N-6 DNA methylase [Geoglobus acetivorans]|uniref:DNA methylase n=1 Tax=Geoglobus acetivorans TaxID=565033 RepID=A0A0A7GEF7_GEOAI|nr:DNA methylase [Geoglobus acetivorans]
MWREILYKLNIEPITPDSFKIFISSLKTIMKYTNCENLKQLELLDAPILPNLKKLNSTEADFITSKLAKSEISINECQILVQKILPQGNRKKFAAYYTIDQGTNFMALIARRYIERSKKRKIVLTDPFLGSGRTLTTAIQKIGTTRLQKVWGIEPLSLPAIVAYASLLKATNGRKELISVIVGDAFEEIPRIYSSLSSAKQTELPKADIILTNPPFTRWKYLEKGYRSYLLEVISKLNYKKFITRKEPSLQILSMFLCDYVLNDGGLIATVLPASTFYTIYGKGYKSFLRKKYGILGVVSNFSKASFSEDSGFKELILVATKGYAENNKRTLFCELNDNVEELASAIISGNMPKYNENFVDLYDLPRFMELNWLAFLGKKELVSIITDIFKQGLKNGTLGYWDDVLGDRSIVRGVEMYGPDFFFVPNKYWKVVENGQIIRIQDTNGVELSLDSGFLVKTLRKPSIYSSKIEADVNTFMLSVPPLKFEELPDDLRHYIKWGIDSGAAKPAINAYGEYWYSHVYRQITTKRPFGQVFIPDKVDLLFKRRSVFANYTRSHVAASKNFYIVKDKNDMIAKLLVAWFNSTVFISMLTLFGRKISETWTRLLERDYLELPVININSINRNSLVEIITIIDEILDRPLPPFWNQLNQKYRYDLDLSILKAINVENPEKIIDELYKFFG